MTPDITSLDEVVVTGQFAPQSINQSVHTVKAIDRARIENQGAVDLADVLSNNLNITLTPNKSDGRTSISMLGLDGQYVKILIDGVSFAGVDGNGNNADISQINLNIIERIEIVEGPMAVNYGANALGGVINLITKKSALNSISIQEETVSSEYGLKQGRHIQTLSLGHKLRMGFYCREISREMTSKVLEMDILGKITRLMTTQEVLTGTPNFSTLPEQRLDIRLITLI